MFRHLHLFGIIQVSIPKCQFTLRFISKDRFEVFLKILCSYVCQMKQNSSS